MKVAVVGGGIAGLAAAWELANQPGAGGTVDGVEVTVIEPGPLGGKLQTAGLGDGMVELGPDAFLTRVPEAVQLCQELGVQDDLVAPAAGKAELVRGGRLRPLPGGTVLGAPRDMRQLAASRVLSPVGLVRAAAEPLIPATRLPDDPTVWELVSSRFGSEVAERLVDPLVGGIHAGRIDELSAAVTTPQLMAAAGKGRSLLAGLRALPVPPSTEDPLFLAPSKGFSALVDTLTDRLRSKGVEFFAGTCEDVTPADGAAAGDEGPGGWVVHPHLGVFDRVVLAVPAHVAGRLLGRLGTSTFTEIPWASVGMVVLAFPPSEAPPAAGRSGFLVSRQERTLVTACSFATAKWPHWHQDHSVLRVSVGRHGDERWTKLDDAELVKAVTDELSKIFRKGLPAPATWKVARWADAFPQYTRGHLDRVAKIEQSLPTGIAVAGASYRGSGIPACIGSGRQAAKQVLAG